MVTEMKRMRSWLIKGIWRAESTLEMRSTQQFANNFFLVFDSICSLRSALAEDGNFERLGMKFSMMRRCESCRKLSIVVNQFIPIR